MSRLIASTVMSATTASKARPLRNAAMTSARASPNECFPPGGRRDSQAANQASPSAAASEAMWPASLPRASEPNHQPARNSTAA